MPKIRILRRPPPQGWELLKTTLEELEQKIRDAENDSHDSITSYIYNLFYRQKAISRELYHYCIRERIVDWTLIVKWEKRGYENRCCLRRIQASDTSYTKCCRVPKLEEGQMVIVHNGCRECAD